MSHVICLGWVIEAGYTVLEEVLRVRVGEVSRSILYYSSCRAELPGNITNTKEKLATLMRGRVYGERYLQ